MINQNYQLVIKFDVKAIDSIDARLKTRQILKDARMDGGILNGDHSIPEIKLQQIFNNKQPERVEL
ncbi:MAG: hypothetical protein WC119_01285 [Synergistaceae bacterium]